MQLPTHANTRTPALLRAVDELLLGHFNERACIASHRIAPHCIPPHRIAPHRIASHPTASHRTPPHRISSQRTALHRTASRRMVAVANGDCASARRPITPWRANATVTRGARPSAARGTCAWRGAALTHGAAARAVRDGPRALCRSVRRERPARAAVVLVLRPVVLMWHSRVLKGVLKGCPRVSG
jgi:hypothetical protein